MEIPEKKKGERRSRERGQKIKTGADAFDGTRRDGRHHTIEYYSETFQAGWKINCQIKTVKDSRLFLFWLNVTDVQSQFLP